MTHSRPSLIRARRDHKECSNGPELELRKVSERNLFKGGLLQKN